MMHDMYIEQQCAPPKMAQLQTMGAIGTLKICGLTTWTRKEI